MTRELPNMGSFRRQIKRGLTALREFAAGPSDPVMTEHDRRLLDPHEKKETEAFRIFERELSEAEDEAATSRIVDDYHNDTRRLRARIRSLEAAPWKRAAAELDIQLPLLVDEDGEPDDQAFAMLKRVVRKGLRSRHREVWEFFALRMTLAATVGGLMFAGLSLYVEHVFQKDLLTVTVTDVDFDNKMMKVSGLLANGGNRPIAVRTIRPSVRTHFPGLGKGSLSRPIKTANSSEFPLILAAAEIRHFEVFTDYDQSTAYGDDRQGRFVEREVKLLDYECDFELLDGSGQIWMDQVAIYSQHQGPAGLIRGSGVEMLKPAVLLERRRWLGALAR